VKGPAPAKAAENWDERIKTDTERAVISFIFILPGIWEMIIRNEQELIALTQIKIIG
jgi:hypothetical protein